MDPMDPEGFAREMAGRTVEGIEDGRYVALSDLPEPDLSDLVPDPMEESRTRVALWVMRTLQISGILGAVRIRPRRLA